MTLIDPHCEHGKRIGDLHDQCHECLDAKRVVDTPFLRALRSVGGVKPCQVCGPSHKELQNAFKQEDIKWVPCSTCHGTGQILDLAPLLAKPNDLVYVVTQLLGTFHSKVFKAAKDSVAFVCKKWKGFKNLHIVGPQRASNLVYEIARQLGGTAVVAEEHWSSRQGVGECGSTSVYNERTYRLSLPIPPDATVLFVTDRLDDSGEMLEVIKAVGCTTRVLPYLLCLVVAGDVQGLHNRDQILKVIALHEEQ